MDTISPMNKALFLDRDGTIIVDKHYQSKPELIELIPGVIEALQLAKEKGYLLFIHTNQSGIGRGYFTLDDVHACNKRMLELIGLGDDLFTEICIAPEHPKEEHIYRKPSPKFVFEMIDKYHLDPHQCYFIGDRIPDLRTALNAKIKGIHVTCGEPITEEVEVLINEGKVISRMDLKEFVDDL